jgi:hypothetical protein
MIIKLFQPPTKNWLLIAEQLDDPETWDRFIPCHTVTSQRWRFDCTVKQSCSDLLKLKSCKDLLKRGTSIFEYDWTVEEDDILSHAIQIAEKFDLELSMEAPSLTPFRTAA